MIHDYGKIVRQPRSGHPYKIGFGMTLLSAEDEQICAFVACRDRLHDYFKASYYGQREKGDSHAFYPENGDPLPCTKELKLLLLLDHAKHSLKNISLAISNWHLIEEYAGIEKTKVELVRYEEGPLQNTKGLVLLTGNKMYTKFPQLLSAMTLFLRFGFFNPQFVIKNVKDLDAAFKTACGDEYGLVKDGHYMKAIVGQVLFILKNRDELFEGLIETDLFPLGDPVGFHAYSGIVALCKSNNIVGKLNLRLRRMQDQLAI